MFGLLGETVDVEFEFEVKSERLQRLWIADRKDKVDKDGLGFGFELGAGSDSIDRRVGLEIGLCGFEKDRFGLDDFKQERQKIGNDGVSGKVADRGKGKSFKEAGGFSCLADLLVKQGEFFCREIWPGLSIRNKFFNHCNINETSNTAPETLPFMTEMESEVTKIFTNVVKKTTTHDYLGYDLPDLSFMLTASIQWPSEYLKQI